MKKILTLEQLMNFCADNKLYHFNSQESGYKICVQVESEYKTFEEKSTDSMCYGLVKLIHTNRNRNGSNVTKTAMEKCMPSIKYKPLLANFCDLEEGEKDFTSHDFEIDEDGNINYIEHQIGCFTVDEPYIEYDEENDRHYLYAYVAIPKEYTPAFEIIERKGGTKVSAEIAVNEMKYDAKNKELLLEDIEIMGATCLGTNPETMEEVQEGMEGARLDLVDFSVKNDEKIICNEKLIDAIERLNTTLSMFNINDPARKEEEAQMEEIKDMEVTEDVVEETVEKVTETEEATEEDVTEVEEEIVETEEPVAEDTPVVVEESVEEVVETEAEEEPVDDGTVKCSVTIGKNTRNFSVSMNAKIEALATLVNDTYADDCTYYGVEVYDDDRQVVMIDYWNGNAYRQNYKVKNDVFSLTGDRVKVHSTWLTDDEQKAFDKMKNDFAELQTKFTETDEKLQKYESEPDKMNILNSSDYLNIADSKEFVAFKEQKNHFDLTVDEVKEKADSMLLEYAKKGNLTFANKEINKEIGMMRIPTEKTKTKKSRYGNLFANED